MVNETEVQQASLYGGCDYVPDVVVEPTVREGAASDAGDDVIVDVEEERQPLPPDDQVRRSMRVRRRPAYLDDYVTSDNDAENM